MSTELLMPMLGLLLTIILFVALMKLLQRYTNLGAQTNPKDSLQLQTVKYIDNNNKLIKLTSNNTEYLVLVGKNNHLLIDKYDKTTQ